MRSQRSLRAELLVIASALLSISMAADAAICTGVLGEGGVCCKRGCGQSRQMCLEAIDVCNQGTTTKAMCCPSAIRAAAVPCTPEQGPPCVVMASAIQPIAVPKAITTPKANKAARLCHGGGWTSADGRACCKAGCGQSRKQCEDAADLCSQSDTTSQACCPRVILSSGVVCSPETKPPCILMDKGLVKRPMPPPPMPLPLASPPPVLRSSECKGVLGPGGACCKVGCGQSRKMCEESADMCDLQSV